MISLEQQRLDQRVLSFQSILHVHLTPGARDQITFVRLLTHCLQPELEAGCVQGFALTTGPHSFALKRLRSATEWLFWEQARPNYRGQIWSQYFKTMSCVPLTQLLFYCFAQDLAGHPLQWRNGIPWLAAVILAGKPLFVRYPARIMLT